MREQTQSPSAKAARFSLKKALQLVEAAVRPFPKAVLFELAERGWTASFRQALACMISVRTRDDVTISVAECLLARASTPDRLLRLSVGEVHELIRPSTFAETKAHNMLEIARIAWTQYGGVLCPAMKRCCSRYLGLDPNVRTLSSE